MLLSHLLVLPFTHGESYGVKVTISQKQHGFISMAPSVVPSV